METNAIIAELENYHADAKEFYDQDLTYLTAAADRLSEQQQVIEELADSLTQIVYITDRKNVIWDKAKIALSRAKEAGK